MGGKRDKAIDRLKLDPKDYTFSEARSLLIKLGYKEYNKGKTSGSKVMFVKGKPDGMDKICLHKPHPGDEMKSYAVKELREHLEAIGEI